MPPTNANPSPVPHDLKLATEFLNFPRNFLRTYCSLGEMLTAPLSRIPGDTSQVSTFARQKGVPVSAMSWVYAVSVHAPVPRVPFARHRHALPARQVSSTIRETVGGGGFAFAKARGDVCSTSASGSDTTTDTTNWRHHAFSQFCDDALSNDQLAVGLRAMEQRHPSIDPSIILFTFWRATLAGDEKNTKEMSHQELKAAAKVSDRWRLRISSGLRTVHASLNGEDLVESPAARAVIELVAEAERSAVAAERTELHDLATNWDRFGETYVESTSAPTSDEASTYVHGATATACDNFRLYTEYLGISLTRSDWTQLRGVFEGCMSLRQGGWDVVGEVKVWGDSTEEASEDAYEDNTSFATTDQQWRSIRRAIDESLSKPKKLSQKARNFRYEKAKRNLTYANKLWKQTALEYKHARNTVKAARHEVHKTRKVVRNEWR